MSYKWQTQYARHQVKGEKNTGKHCTVPNQALSIQTLLERHAKGLPLEDVRTPIYEHHGEVEDEDFAPDVSKMDMFDRMEMAASAKQDYQDKVLEVQLDLKEKKSRKKEKETKPLEQAALPLQQADPPASGGSSLTAKE